MGRLDSAIDFINKKIDSVRKDINDGLKGTIGIIGPKRMDYEKVVESLKTIQTQMDEVFKKT